jgi:hypothetical protein
MLNDPEVVAEVAAQPNGFVFIVDRRAPEGEEVEKEDVIGIYLVNENETDVNRYRPNPEYKLISKRGVGKFAEEVEVELMRVLLAL